MEEKILDSLGKNLSDTFLDNEEILKILLEPLQPKVNIFSAVSSIIPMSALNNLQRNNNNNGRNFW